MLETLLRLHERGGEVEDLLAVLDGDHPPRGEAAAVPGPVHLEDDRHGGVARPDEITVQRVADAVFHRLIGGQQRLADHLAAEDAAGRVVRCRTAEEVHFDALELERLGQVLGFHEAPLTPRPPQRQEGPQDLTRPLVAALRRPMSFDATVLTMFPEAFPGPLGVSLIGTAWREQGLAPGFGLWKQWTFGRFPKISAASSTTPPRVAALDR
jgi:hypothetical protein